MPNVSVGIKGIYRNYGRVIEDFLCIDDGTYCIGNPGEGTMKQVFTLDYSQQFAAPKPKRTYKGIQLDANKSFSNNWQGMASYVYFTLEGNYDGEYAPFTNIGPIRTSPPRTTTTISSPTARPVAHHEPRQSLQRPPPPAQSVGHLPHAVETQHRRFRLLAQRHSVTRYGFSDAYRRYEFFLTPAAPKAARPTTTTPTSTSATPSPSAARRSISSSTFSTSSTRNAQSCSTNATASRKATTRWQSPRTRIT